MNEQALALSTSHLMPALSVQQAVERFQAMGAYIQRVMKPGIDYGTIPGTPKPTLLKPGAEKLTTFFGLTVKFLVIEKTEDWIGEKFSGEPFFYYWFRCQLWRGDMLIAEADGSCNSRESKYRWRWVAAEDVPAGYNLTTLKTRKGGISEFDFAVGKAETTGKYGKPAEYWQRFQDAISAGAAKKIKRTTAKGQVFDAWEIDSTVYRVPNEDVYSQVNTVQKMSQKRALVAATLLAVNASEFFTQDIEDLDLDGFVDGEWRSVDAVPSPTLPTEERPQPRQQEPLNGSRPYDAPTVRGYIRKKSGAWLKGPAGDWADAQRNDEVLTPPAPEAVQRLAAVMSAAVKSPTLKADDVTERRHGVIAYVAGVASTSQLSAQEVDCWLGLWADGYNANQYAPFEAAAVYAAFQEQAGQMELPPM